MRSVTLLLFIVLLSACAGTGTSLVEVRATQTLQTGAFSMPYDHLAACVKARIKSDPWTFGQPVVGSEWGVDRRIVRVYATYARSTLFEVTFQAISPVTTRVDYRRSNDGHGTQEHAWSIIEQCASPIFHHHRLPVQAGRDPPRYSLESRRASGLFPGAAYHRLTRDL